MNKQKYFLQLLNIVKFRFQSHQSYFMKTYINKEFVSLEFLINIQVFSFIYLYFISDNNTGVTDWWLTT